MKQAKEEAQDEIEKYRQEREKQFKEFEIKVNILFIFLIKHDLNALLFSILQHMGSREDVAARIDADTKIKIEEMNKAVSVNKQAVIEKILELVYDIKPELHKNFKATINRE